MNKAFKATANSSDLIISSFLSKYNELNKFKSKI